MKNLSVTLIQADLIWQDPLANLTKFDHFIDEFTRPTDIIILPEMFTTGFSMEAKALAEEMGGLSMQWMAQKAKNANAVIAGSLIITESSHYYNRFIWMRPDGRFEYYDKRHLFAMAGEHEHYKAGEQRVLIEYKGWKICPQVCYDLRFPVWSRNDLGYDLLIYVANWPERRTGDWDTLLRARAIENQSYVIGVNRCGTDGLGLHYTGHSTIIDPAWHGVHYKNEGREEVFQFELDAQHLQEVRKSLPFLKDKDAFTIL